MAENGNSKNENRALLQGRYEINELLGEGKFANVYHACNITSAQSVAIKVINKEKVLTTGLSRQIKREIHCLRRVRHPNIVQILEVMASKAKIYIVMEYVSGGELFKKFTKGPLKEQVVRKYFRQLVSAVEFWHFRGVFHRDLKPQNLLLDENGNLKVSDFGLSTLSDQVSHTFCGMPAYLAPEVLLLAKKGYCAKVDVWSCGVILFELMAGYSPFHGNDVMTLYKGKFRCPRWFSSKLIWLLNRLLDANPKARITIPEIMENKWFKKGFKRVKFYVGDGDQLCNVEDEKDDVASALNQSIWDLETQLERKQNKANSFPRPTRLNAFDIISFSCGLDLSRLFEENEEVARFVSHAPVSEIISKLEEIAKVVNFTVRHKGCLVSLHGARESVEGPLVVTVEIFELILPLLVVELKRKGGDRGGYEELCYKELKLGLQDLVMEESSSASHILPSFFE